MTVQEVKNLHFVYGNCRQTAEMLRKRCPKAEADFIFSDYKLILLPVGFCREKESSSNGEERRLEVNSSIFTLFTSDHLHFWPAAVAEALTDLSKGPHHSKIDSGEVLFIAISDIRNSLSLHDFSIDTSASQGFALFFDDLLPRDEAAKWFEEVVPQLANLLLRLPSLLETHYENADDGVLKGVKTGLRLLESQEPGIVFISQELIGALLACYCFVYFLPVIEVSTMTL
ncbi:hypothetical protein H5410_064767 [Solanum commersonii]|uniref:PARG helical domain-containing protein n=1 Tax=Solanum commersonii TaxID=4109 RepID=A0A9J5VYH1_SOLCO|nr:hypothetical protein H5410_064767 [Solanum commersonii]